eukprot:TRINITY_DN1438_c0_g1_i1.p7 TRINITY_DN1438_c0_g1~~TRINITY_DN1438_c0_g1_i1.p7  ORF type:complete len:138 (-),score=7.73 TRINITY_DN1438_c0_g1_i1:774-1187(-)
MAKYGKLGQMYPILGNHEGMPCDEFDVYSQKHQWILNNATEFWQNWFTKECILFCNINWNIAQEIFRETGCYSQLHPGTTLRIIGLFPLAADSMNPYLWKNSTNPWKLVKKNCALNLNSWIGQRMSLETVKLKANRS